MHIFKSVPGLSWQHFLAGPKGQGFQIISGYIPGVLASLNYIRPSIKTIPHRNTQNTSENHIKDERLSDPISDAHAGSHVSRSQSGSGDWTVHVRAACGGTGSARGSEGNARMQE